jgi:hypothetical protein
MSERTYGGQTAAQWRGSVWCSEVMRAMLHHIDELQADLATASKGYAGRVREIEAHVAALRAALESSLIYVESFPSSNAHDLAAIKAALAATPEQSLAALRNEAAAEALDKWADGHADYMITWSPPAQRGRDLTICRLLKAEAQRMREAANG